VALVGQPVETSEGSVEIEYEGTEAMNLPLKGSATCTFAVGEGDRAYELPFPEGPIPSHPVRYGLRAGIRPPQWPTHRDGSREPEDRLALTVPEAAPGLRLSKRHLRHGIPHVRIGRGVVIPVDLLRGWSNE
jgi:hypothetical protein